MARTQADNCQGRHTKFDRQARFEPHQISNKAAPPPAQARPMTARCSSHAWLFRTDVRFLCTTDDQTALKRRATVTRGNMQLYSSIVLGRIWRAVFPRKRGLGKHLQPQASS